MQDFKFSIEKSHFEDLLEKISTVVPSKDARPILRNIKFEVGDSRLRLIATDLELSLVSATTKVMTYQCGNALIPAKKLIEIVKESSSEVVTIEIEYGTANVVAGQTNWSLKLVDSIAYPPLPEIAEIQLHKVYRQAFLDAIGAVKGAIGADNSRPNLHMLVVDRNRIIACDGSRFQQAQIEFPVDIQIPSRAVADLCKIMKMSEIEQIDVGSTWNHLVFRIGSDIFIVNKLAVEFPDIEQTMLAPALSNTEILVVEREPLIAAIRQVRINADPETLSITLNLGLDYLSVKGTDKYGNNCTALLDAQYQYPDLQITVNHKYLLEMLSMMQNPICEFYLGRNTKSYKAPLMLKDKSKGIIGVVQQMRSDVLLSTLLRAAGVNA